MEVKNEKVPYENKLLPIRVFMGRRNYEHFVAWHYHKEIEMLVILEGTLDVYVEDELYSLMPGDVILIGSFQLHRDRSFADVHLRYIVFQFDIQPYFDSAAMPYLNVLIKKGFPLNCMNYIFSENQEARLVIRDCVEEIFNEAKTKSSGYELAVSMLIRKIVLTIVRGDSRKLLELNERTDLSRLQPVLDYIDENFTNKVNVKDACRLANLSYFYFTKYFKKTMGMSFVEYVNYYKIKRAERILLTQDMSIAQVGEEIGMPNMAHFNKFFYRYNQCSPSQFRKMMQKW